MLLALSLVLLVVVGHWLDGQQARAPKEGEPEAEQEADEKKVKSVLCMILEVVESFF